MHIPNQVKPTDSSKKLKLEEQLFKQAHQRIKPCIHTTPCPKSDLLSAEIGADVFLKCEMEQVSGSFKIRGVLNKILSLSEMDRKRPLVAASTGNHGAAFAYVVSKFNLNGHLFVPENITLIKQEAIEAFGISLTVTGADCVETEVTAAHYATQRDCVFVSPYNDVDIILGQGTISIELIEQLGEFDFVFVPVGGGGLASGIATYLKSVAPKTKIIGCQPENSHVMFQSIKAGHIVTMESLSTLADAAAGGIESDAITFEMCRTLVDDFVILSEDEIFSALKSLHLQEKIVAEGASAMTVAAIRKMKDQVEGKRVVLVISGGKIDPTIIKKFESS